LIDTDAPGFVTSVGPGLVTVVEVSPHPPGVNTRPNRLMGVACARGIIMGIASVTSDAASRRMAKRGLCPFIRYYRGRMLDKAFTYFFCEALAGLRQSLHAGFSYFDVQCPRRTCWEGSRLLPSCLRVGSG
jgi:hypothetical protein